MNKKQNLLAIALSASFVLAGTNIAEASEDKQVVEDISLLSLDETTNSVDNKEEDFDLSEAMTVSSKETNYSEDEKEIKNYSGSERYRETDLQPGDPNQEFYNTDEKEVKDGFKFELKNPSSTSPSKTEYGYQITIDKKTGQRTYTSISVTDSGLIPAQIGEKPMMGVGE